MKARSLAALGAAEREESSLRSQLTVRERQLAGDVTSSEISATAKTTEPVTVKAAPSTVASIPDGGQANPPLRELAGALMKAEFQTQYAELFDKLGLSESERAIFTDIITVGNSKLIDGYMFTLGNGETSLAGAYDQLKKTFGEEIFQKYREYRLATSARDVSNELTRSLYYTTTPLEGRQIEQIRTVISGALADPRVGPRYDGPWQSIPLPVWEFIMAGAKETLSPQQYAVLQGLHDRSAFFTESGAARRELAKKTKP